VVVVVQMEQEPLALEVLVVVEMEQFHLVLQQEAQEPLIQAQVAAVDATGDLQEVLVAQAAQV
jgi:hypothetical protein